jgi:hypothetical protein
MKYRTYLELIQLPTFEERFEYCKCSANPSSATFGGHRLLNQMLYNSFQWKEVRSKVIIRDEGCDLGIADRPINSKILIHHLNPITIEQVMNHDPCVFDPNNLICVSFDTHNAIHYGNIDRLTPSTPIERTPGDIKLW